MKALLSAIFFLLVVLGPLPLFSQEGGDGNLFIDQINDFTTKQQFTGYRHNTDIYGADCYLHGYFYNNYWQTIEMRLYLNGVNQIFSYTIDDYGEWSC